mgnify:CR=1 FL=1
MKRKDKIKALQALISECDNELKQNIHFSIEETQQMRQDAIKQLKELTQEA